MKRSRFMMKGPEPMPSMHLKAMDGGGVEVMHHTGEKHTFGAGEGEKLADHVMSWHDGIGNHNDVEKAGTDAA